MRSRSTVFQTAEQPSEADNMPKLSRHFMGIQQGCIRRREKLASIAEQRIRREVARLRQRQITAAYYR